MSAAKHTPGPWMVHALSKPQPCQFYVARPVEDGTWSSPHWEQLPSQDGSPARFETADAALSAIAQATGA